MKLLEMTKTWGTLRDSEDGGITIMSLFLFLGMLMAAGLAVDVNNMVQSRTQLQGSADAAGHAALYWRWRNSEGDSKLKALEVARMNMPQSRYGDVLSSTDIEFGDWDGVGRTFTPQPGNNTAVRVSTRRLAANSNGITTFLMKFIGLNTLEVNTTSVWDHEEGWCPRGEGFFAVDIVDIQSNNNYHDGFCIHSETHVELQQGGYFEDGVVVSMPNEADVVLPNSGLAQNAGLAEALDSITHNLTSFFNDLPNLIDAYGNPNSHVNASLINTSTVHTASMNSNITASDIMPNAINVIDCVGKSITIDNNVIIRDAVIITPCEVKFNSGSAIENGTLISTNTGSKAISAPSGFRVGASNYCNDGLGGANLLAMGDITVAAGFQAFGANVIANGDISITSAASGLAGVNVMSNGRIDATSNGDLGFCSLGPPTPFQIPVFRMVM